LGLPHWVFYGLDALLHNNNKNNNNNNNDDNNRQSHIMYISITMHISLITYMLIIVHISNKFVHLINKAEYRRDTNCVAKKLDGNTN